MVTEAAKMTFDDAKSYAFSNPNGFISDFCTVVNVTWIGKNTGGLQGWIGRLAGQNDGVERFKMEVRKDAGFDTEQRKALIDLAVNAKENWDECSDTLYGRASRTVRIYKPSADYDFLTATATGQSAECLAGVGGR